MLIPPTSTLLLGASLALALALSACALGKDVQAKPSSTADSPDLLTAAPDPATLPKAPGFPADYKGTPYKNIAQPIPGRVELENFDEGGLNVAFAVQHHEGDSSGKDYRPGVKPQICITNGSPAEQDKFEGGKRYPSDDLTKNAYYIGYARPDDWVNCTVYVKKAGVYRVSTAAANETRKMTFSLTFNGVKKADVTTDGTGSYHTWKLHENICTVKLDAGLQVMKFQLGTEPHMNYDYMEFVYDENASAEK